ncbi:MAG: GTPase ObgE [Deltaproteobacteria bacterium]|nr:GTPase ObgE [Deltaproteobacteria bacterium]
MRFVDEVEIVVQSGRGGRGSASFRREKFVPFGGPDGGDGGRGGHVIFMADAGLGSLLDLRGRAQWKAADGTAGDFRQMTGADGDDLVVRVPRGTVIRDVDEDLVICELLADGESRVVVEGGKGGLGNVHFKTSTNRAPRKTTPGGPGETRRLRLELKLVADVGLLGFPNAGKSTLISVISAARPKIADYPFTTLVPNLGVVRAGDDNSYVVADIPGLIEGAAEGKGLGHQFLRHVERTRLLLHLVDASEVREDDDPGATPLGRWRVLRDELRRYSQALADRPELVVLTKIDAVSPEALDALKAEFLAAGVEGVHAISAVSGQGVTSLSAATWERLRELAPPLAVDDPLGV